MKLGKYEYVADHFLNWAKNEKDYSTISLKTMICGVHVLGAGIHGSINGYYGLRYLSS